MPAISTKTSSSATPKKSKPKTTNKTAKNSRKDDNEARDDDETRTPVPSPDDDTEETVSIRTTRYHQKTINLRLHAADLKDKFALSFIPWDPDEWGTVRECDAIKVTNVINYQMDTDSPTDTSLNVNQIGALHFHGKNLAILHLAPWSAAMKNMIVARVLNIDGKHKKHKDAISRLGQVRNSVQFKTFEHCDPFSLKYLKTARGKAYTKELNRLVDKPLKRNEETGEMELFLPPLDEDLARFNTEVVMRQILKEVEQSIAWSRCYKEPDSDADEKEFNFFGRLLQVKASLLLQLNTVNLALKMKDGRLREARRSNRRAPEIIHHIPNIDDTSCCVVLDPRFIERPRKIILCFPLPNVPAEYGSRTIVKSTITALNFLPKSVSIEEDELDVLDAMFGRRSAPSLPEPRSESEPEEEEESNEDDNEEDLDGDDGMQFDKDSSEDEYEGDQDLNDDGFNSETEGRHKSGDVQRTAKDPDNNRKSSSGKSQSQSQGSQNGSANKKRLSDGNGVQTSNRTIPTTTSRYLIPMRVGSAMDSVSLQRNSPTRKCNNKPKTQSVSRRLHLSGSPEMSESEAFDRLRRESDSKSPELVIDIYDKVAEVNVEGCLDELEKSTIQGPPTSDEEANNNATDRVEDGSYDTVVRRLLVEGLLEKKVRALEEAQAQLSRLAKYRNLAKDKINTSGGQSPNSKKRSLRTLENHSLESDSAFLVAPNSKRRRVSIDGN